MTHLDQVRPVASSSSLSFIFGAPKRYVQGPGVLARCGVELARIARQVLLLVDPVVDRLTGAAISESAACAGVSLTKLIFSGEVTRDEIQRLRREYTSASPDLIFAVGGGKCLDAGKALAAALNTRIATAPTIASNDAPTSHIYVLYDASHRLLSVEKLATGNPELVLVDTAVIARAPRQQLIAGIGDAISKCFEVRQCMVNGGNTVFGARPSYTAGVLAEACYRLIREHSVGALMELANNAPGEDLERLVEGTVLLSGLSFENGGLSVAHAMTRGLTAIPQLAASPHGMQVAYGLLVQLVLEEMPHPELGEIRAFYAQVGLPLSLSAMGLDKLTRETVNTIAEGTLTAPHIRNFPRVLNIHDLVAAIESVEDAF
jgi:glycerol dehydrogenase